MSRKRADRCDEFYQTVERDRAACPKVETIIGFMNISGYTFNVSWNFAIPSLLSGTIKTSEAIVADFIAGGRS